MNLKKEPILFLVVLALAAWIWSGHSVVDLRRTVAVSPQSKQLEDVPAPVVVLADPSGGSIADRDLFREPTEATPLPPRELPFPSLQPLPVVALPLSPGQDAGAWFQLRMDGGPPSEHTFGEVEAIDDGGDEPEPAVGPQDEQSIPLEVLIERFDRVWLETPNPFFGTILDQDKLDLLLNGPFDKPIKFEFVSRRSGRVTGMRDLDPNRVKRIALAESLENTIALRKRDMGSGPASVQPREEFLRFLIQQARERDWVWKEAEEQAQQIFDITQNETGYRALLRVHRAKGDLAAELALYQGLTGDIADLPARWREQGRFEWQLGLLADAEEHARMAVARSPNDPRNNSMLAAFLLSRGRAAEAVGFAEKAARGVAQVTDEEQRFEVFETHVSTLLAVGRTDDVVSAAARVSGGTNADRACLRGAVYYARGELDLAIEQFERAVEELGSLDAVLGLGACALRQGRWDDARQLLERVRKDAPALRARALAGLGLLYERTDHAEAARTALEDAERAAPRDAYVLYLLGRRLRLDGEFDASLAMLRRALAERDETVEALAETALALLQRAADSPDELPELYARAVRFVDRLVELDQERAGHVPFLELQGYVLSLVGDVAQARRAFQVGATAGSAFCQIGLALLDYRQKRVSDARTALAQISNDPARDPEVRGFARTIVDLIDNHAGKEQVRDRFDREDVGALWTQVGRLRPALQEGRLVLRGGSGRVGEESALRRSVKAGDFLSVEVGMEIVGERSTTNFAGLRLERVAGGDFLIELGVRRYGPREQAELRIVDGRPRAGESTDPIALDVAFEPGQRLALRFEFVPDPDPNSNRMNLRAIWNGRLVHERTLKSVNERASFELATDLLVQGSPVHVAFDDYRLVRRKEY